MGSCGSTLATQRRISDERLADFPMRNSGGSSSSSSSSSSSRRRGSRWAVVREHRSRFYIFRKCIVMLIMWHKYGKLWFWIISFLLFNFLAFFFSFFFSFWLNICIYTYTSDLYIHGFLSLSYSNMEGVHLSFMHIQWLRCSHANV